MRPTIPAVRTFLTPREIVWGRGSVSHLEKIKGGKALLVTDKVMVKVGAAAKVEDYLKKAGFTIQVFSDVEPEFVTNTVMKMVEQHKSFCPDVIVGLGGGSSLDAAKAFRVFYEHPQLTFDDIWFNVAPPKKPIPPFAKTVLITIPTTSGTGSEVSSVFVVTDPGTHNKCVIGSPHLMANIAILDPDFVDSLPRTVAIDTGFDALSHAIPSYISTFSNDFSKGCAIQAIRLIFKYLASACDGDKEAKEHMHYAACLAGKAFANTALGVEHIIAHRCGAAFHISHGRACAIALPHVIRFNASAAEKNLTEMITALGYSNGDHNKAVSYLINLINNLQKQLGVALSYREHGVSEVDYKAELPRFIKVITETPMLPALLSNPQECLAENSEELFATCYYGRKPSRK